MSCLVEDFRFCLLIGVGGFWFLRGEGNRKKKKKASEDSWAVRVQGGGWAAAVAYKTAELHWTQIGF